MFLNILANDCYKMALDGKTIIKEEITEKDTYESATTNSSRRNKLQTNPSKESINNSNSSSSNNSTSSSNHCGGNNSRGCRTPDSPESARAIAPRSPMSPQIHHSSLAPPPRPNRNASASPVVNGATTTPPPTVQSTVVAQAAVAAAHVEQARVLSKIRKFLGSLVQLTQELNPELTDRVRALVLSLGSGGISIDEFRIGLQELVNLPLRPYVVPLLKNHVTLLQREIAALSRATNQTTHQYVTSNENAVMEFTSHGPPPEYGDIFVQIDPAQTASNGNVGSLAFKRRHSDTLMEHHNGVQDWNDYMASAYPTVKRLHAAHNPHLSAADTRISYSGPQTLFDYSATSASAQSENSFSSLIEKSNHRDERDLRNSATNENPRHLTRSSIQNTNNSSTSTGGGEEEWKNIHTMLNCISAMVEKTKRAITILQQRGVEPQPTNFNEISPVTLLEIRRQTEEKVAEFKRNAEDAVNQVKRQAVIEIQRAVVAAETRAAEVMTQERLRMEKLYVEMSRHSVNERELENKSPSIAAGQNSCWNCGRKATETCSGCNLARYCGAFCQHKDWEHHHQICGTTRSNDLSSKHVPQVIPLPVNVRAGIARSPPTPSQTVVANTQQQPQQQQQQQGGVQVQSSSGGGTAQPSSLVPNGVGSK